MIYDLLERPTLTQPSQPPWGLTSHDPTLGQAAEPDHGTRPTRGRAPHTEPLTSRPDRVDAPPEPPVLDA